MPIDFTQRMLAPQFGVMGPNPVNYGIDLNDPIKYGMYGFNSNTMPPTMPTPHMARGGSILQHQDNNHGYAGYSQGGRYCGGIVRLTKEEVDFCRKMKISFKDFARHKLSTMGA
jgi:hypothetical protein